MRCLECLSNILNIFAGRLLVGFFWFSVLVFTSTYTANLAAFFTSTKTNDDITNMESLLKNGYSFSLLRNYALYHFFATSEFKVYQQIFARIKAQNSFSNKTADALSKLRADPYLVFITEGPDIQWRINKKPCEFRLGR